MVNKTLNSEHMAEKFKEQFGVEIETSWNIISGCHVTRRLDEKDFTREQSGWLSGYDASALA